jgi:UDP-2,4-diacetamido-2,4,6-trideoxy-beta-L-altropyranose hydrolase
MNVFIRADASSQIGIGHVMRCLTLVEDLRQAGSQVSFLCTNLYGNMIQYIEDKGHSVYPLTTLQENEFDWYYDAEQVIQIIKNNQVQVDWLVVDHYQIDIRWEHMLRDHVKHLFVIDDIADRIHDCEILLDQNYYRDASKRYESLIPIHTMKLLGPAYALLRNEFRQNRQLFVPGDGSIQRILVFFGGSDTTNETAKAIKALMQSAFSEIKIDVVVGDSNPRKATIESLCKDWSQSTFHCQIENMADLMLEADLAIGAGGTATWERMFLGLPTIAIIVADNQKESIYNLAQDDYVWSLGRSSEVTASQISDFLQLLIRDPNLLINRSKRLIEFMPYDPRQTLLPHVRYMLEWEGTTYNNIDIR